MHNYNKRKHKNKNKQTAIFVEMQYNNPTVLNEFKITYL